MPTTTMEKLRDALKLGLGIVTEISSYPAKDWVTSLFAADIDGDGYIEIIAGSNDGRVYGLYFKKGHVVRKWKQNRIIGTKDGVNTVAAAYQLDSWPEVFARIIVGTQDKKVYVLDKAGQTITRDGNILPFDPDDGRTIDQEQERKAHWYNTGNVIRQIVVDPLKPSEIIMGLEDRCAYGLDYQTGEPLWQFKTNGGVRALHFYDINGNEQAEILVGSADGYLYLLNRQGQLIDKYRINYPIHKIFVADIDHDGQNEILVASDDKDLIALVYLEGQEANDRFVEKWRRSFDKRLLALCVTDIDGDRREEIIASSEDKHIYILDAEGNILWRHDYKYRVFSIYPVDLDNDDLPELLIGTEDNYVRAMRLRLSRDIEKKVRLYYRKLRKEDPASLSELTAEEGALLQDILQPEKKELVTLQQAQEFLNVGEHAKALSTLLELEQQKVERVWHKGDIGHINSICLRQVANETKREIVVGASNGDVYAFTFNGRQAWHIRVKDRIIDMQTGFIDHQKQEEIVICSSDHHVYILSGRQNQNQRPVYSEDTQVSSVWVTAPDIHNMTKIIIGSEDQKLYIYDNILQKPIKMITINEGVKIVRAHSLISEHAPEIIAASLGNRVYAYDRNLQLLWNKEITRDSILSVSIKDIDGDDKVEVLVGSEDRNLHVLDSTGNLLWRYYLPHNVLAVDAANVSVRELVKKTSLRKETVSSLVGERPADADIDGGMEVFVGCEDGCLYVFNKEGDLLWIYQANDRIRAVRVDDIDNDGNIEIVVGAEDELELLRIVDRHQVSLMIDQCWSALCQHSTTRKEIEALLDRDDRFLQVFALHKLATQGELTPEVFDYLTRFVEKGALEVRKALVRVVMILYPLNPSSARTLLSKLGEREPDVQNAIIEHISLLIGQDWETGFLYLKRASENHDRFVRRMVVRELHYLIDALAERPVDRHQEIFSLLLTAVRDVESEWVRQEAAHTLAHYLDQHQESFIVYVHLFIVKNLHPNVWEQIAYKTKSTVIRRYINSVSSLLSVLSGFDKSNVWEKLQQNVREKLQQMVQAQTGTEKLLYGEDIRLIYSELYHLFTLETLEDISHYQCELHESQFHPNNQFARNVLPVFKKLSTISRLLKMYFRREWFQDQQNSLLEAIEAVDRMHGYLDQQYSASLLGEPMNRLPDYQIFVLLFKKWKGLMQTQWNELRGKAELKLTLLTRDVRKEKEVGIWISIKNFGRSSANDVKITLLHNKHFEVVGSNSFETESIPAGEETNAEFILKPCDISLNLKFEVVFDDSTSQTKMEEFEDYIELRDWHQEFRPIPNPYSTGTPTHDSRLFYGRQKEMAFLKNYLTRDVKSVVVLYGQRRSGKTSMLVQLINSPVLGEHIPVLLDMQRVSYHVTIENFLRRVAYSIEQAMKRKGISITAPKSNTFKLDPIHAFDVFLDQIEERLAGRKLILLIDEFEVLEEQVTSGKLQPEIFEYLRDIVQHRQKFNFLFSGTHRITEYTRWYRSIFFNIAVHYRLTRLTTQGAEELIQKPVEGYLEYEPLTVQKIHQLTADQPYLIHLVCRAIVDYCNEQHKNYVTINDVNIVLHEVMKTGRFHFEWLWNQIKPEERVALAAIAACSKEGGRWLLLTEIEEVYRRYPIPYKNDHLLETLKTLIEADIIELEQDDIRKSRFRIPVGLTRSWMLKEHSLEVVCKVVQN